MTRDFKSELLAIQSQYILDPLLLLDPEDPMYVDEPALYDLVQTFIDALNGSVGSILLNTRFPIKNSYFSQYEDLTTEMAPWADTYQSYSPVQADFEFINEMFDIDLVSIAYDEVALTAFGASLFSSIGRIDTITSEVMAYFGRLKILMADFNILQRMFKLDLPFDDSMYFSRSVSSKDKIDLLYWTRINDGAEAYSQLFGQMQFDIKTSRA